MSPEITALATQIQSVLPALCEQIRPETGLPFHGKFDPVFITFPNPHAKLYSSNIHLIIQGDGGEGETRFLDVKVESPSGKSSASIGYMAVGNKHEILKVLEAQQANPDRIIDQIVQSARALQEADKA